MITYSTCTVITYTTCSCGHLPRLPVVGNYTVHLATLPAMCALPLLWGAPRKDPSTYTIHVRIVHVQCVGVDFLLDSFH